MPPGSPCRRCSSFSEWPNRVLNQAMFGESPPFAFFSTPHETGLPSLSFSPLGRDKSEGAGLRKSSFRGLCGPQSDRRGPLMAGSYHLARHAGASRERPASRRRRMRSLKRTGTLTPPSPATECGRGEKSSPTERRRWCGSSNHAASQCKMRFLGDECCAQMEVLPGTNEPPHERALVAAQAGERLPLGAGIRQLSRNSSISLRLKRLTRPIE